MESNDTPHRIVTSVKTRNSNNTTSLTTPMAAEAFQSGDRVYVKTQDHSWVPAILKTVELENIISRTDEGKELVCKQREDVLHCTSVSLCDTYRLSDLAPLNEATVLHCLWERFKEDAIYTRAGSTVVAVNPFKVIPGMYSIDTVGQYHTQDSSVKELPHIYEIAEEAYRRVAFGEEARNQCVIVSGESGSGKTVSAKHLLRYLTVVANSPVDGTSNRKLSESTEKGREIEKRILDSNPILEAFGNAATPRNENSSRFGKFIQLYVQRCGVVRGASIETYLLEKTRVVHQGPGDCNFHIFYQLCGMADGDVIGSPQTTWMSELREMFTGHTFSVVPPCNGGRERRSLKTTLKAMSDIGLHDQLQEAVFQVLAAILFVCNVDFSSFDDDSSSLSSESASSRATGQCCHLLGISPSKLEQALLHRSIVSGGDKRRSVFVKPVSLTEARSRRDCLAMLLYSRLFDWLVNFVNQQITTDGKSNIIGLLDIYGFEAFETNSLEQLCINFANEKLQQHYVRHFLADLQREYEEECVPWQHISYHDNQICLDALEGKLGVFGVLNEDVYLSRKSNLQVLGERVLGVNQNIPNAVKQPNKFISHPGFIIHHYAGDVHYSLEHVTNKNKDNIPVELVRLLQHSNNTFLAHLFENFQMYQASKTKRKTVLTKFKASLDGLLSTLKTSDVHYIRCVKPNRASRRDQLDPVYVVQQLKACGILETVEIARRSYSVRFGYRDFLKRYGMLIKEDRLAWSQCDDSMDVDPVDLIQQQLDTPRHFNTPQRVFRRRTGFSSLDYASKCCAAVLSKVLGGQLVHEGTFQDQFGKSKLFLLQNQFEALEIARNQLRVQNAVIIQRVWRMYVRICNQQRRQAAAATIWRNWKLFIGRRRRQHNQATSRIQKAVRCWLSRRRFQSALRTIRTLRTIVPGRRRSPLQPLSVNTTTTTDTEERTSPNKSGSKRPVPSDRQSTKRSRNQPYPGDDSGVELSVSQDGDEDGEDEPPTKRLRTLCQTFRTLKDVNVGDGVVTRRNLTREGMRFHTRASALKNAHIVHKRELLRGLTDCFTDEES